MYSVLTRTRGLTRVKGLFGWQERSVGEFSECHSAIVIWRLPIHCSYSV